MIALCFIPALIGLYVMAVFDALTLKRVAAPLQCQSSPWRMSDDAVDHEMRRELLNQWRAGLSKIQYACLESGATAPLMGWGYAYQFRDYAPPLEVTLTMPGESYTLKSFNGSPALIVEAIKVIKQGVKADIKRAADPYKASIKVSAIPTKPKARDIQPGYTARRTHAPA